MISPYNAERTQQILSNHNGKGHVCTEDKKMRGKRGKKPASAAATISCRE